MIYFFSRGVEFLRCEIRSTLTSVLEYELVVVYPDGRETVERYSSAATVHQRWIELEHELKDAGWWGPSGRAV